MSKPLTSLIKPWFAKPHFFHPRLRGNDRSTIAIIGAGLAGLMNAFQLKQAGFEVEVFDEAKSLPNHQCQNPAMLLRPYLSPDLNSLDQYYTPGFLGMRRFIQEHVPQALIIDSDLQCVVDPNILANFLLQGLRIHLGQTVDPFELKKRFDAVVIATGQFLDFGDPTPGQISIIKEDEHSKDLPILTYQGYCIPDGKGHRIFGSSFRHDGVSLEAREADHLQNLNYLEKAYPELAAKLGKLPYESFVGMRFTARDHLPIVGGLPIKEKWLKDFDRMRFGDVRVKYPDAAYYDGIYVSLAHGSKGLSSSFMASKIILALLTDSPLPIGLSLWNAIHPARFWLRTLKCDN